MIARLLARFRRDASGAVAIVSAFALAGSIFAAALVADTAILYLHKRQAQGATDLAALVAARELAAAARIASGTLADNGFATPEALSVATGRYEADPGRAPTERFAPGGGPANAAHVRMTTRAPVVMWPILTGMAGPTLVTEAVAVNTGLASFSIGSRLASLDGGVLNAVLGQLLGTQVSLTVMDYRSLIDARVDLFDVMDGLGVDLGLAGETYGDLLDLAVGQADLAAAVISALDATGLHAGAVRALERLPFADATVRIGDLVSPGPAAGIPLGGDRAGLAADVSAFDLVTAAARLADGGRAIDVSTGLSLPGLAGLDLRLLVGEPMQGTSWVEVGAEGTTVHTAQTRLLLDVRIGGTGLLAGAQLRVPVYAEVAAGTATLARVRCGYWSPDDTTVTVSARPGLAHLWLGDVDRDRLPLFGSAIVPGQARLAATPLANIDAAANVEIANHGARDINFTRREIRDGTVKTVGTGSFLGPAVGSLFSSADIRVQVLGIGIGLPGLLRGLVGNLLASAAAPLDGVLNAVLRTAGIGLGELDVTVGGVRCDGSALVL